jgi:hypothetical protein
MFQYFFVCNDGKVLSLISKLILEVRTKFGRRRTIPEIQSTSSAKVAEGERQAFNTVIQVILMLHYDKRN